MHVKIKASFTLIFVFIFLLGCINISNIDRGYFIPANDEPAEIEFEVLSDLIIIKAEINGVSGAFLYDNGFSLSAINQEFADRAQIDFDNSSNIRDANGNRASTLETTVDSVKINNQLFLKTGFHLINTDVFFPCDHIDGVIGASIINKANWKINFENRRIQISSVPFKGVGNKLPISISNNNSSFIPISVLGISYKCKIDMGNTTSIKLSQSYAQSSYEGLSAEKRIGVTSISANGLGKVDTVYQLSKNFQLIASGNVLPVQAKILFKDKLKYQGYIGINYLNNYEVIINSTEKEYILLNSKDSPPAEIEKSFGIVLYPVDDIWRIIQIDPYDTLLSKIELMNEVIMIDNLPINRFEGICDYKEYMKMKINKKESLVVSLKDSLSIELPYRRNITKKTVIYNKN